MNTEDAALAVVDPTISVMNVPLAFQDRLQAIAVEDTVDAETPTKLYGAKHLNVSGRVLEAHFTTRVQDVPFVGEATYQNMVRYETECARGDSGGAVVDQQGRLLGIHVAGAETSNRGIFFPVGKYLSDRR